MLASNPTTRTKLKREYIGGRYRIVPKYDIEPCNLFGDNYYIVRKCGRIVTLIPAQDTREQARKRAAAYEWMQRKPAPPKGDDSIPF